ncbi:MAG: hypothetical protein CVU39_09045 [Chloroflexi bacterium HGW-Chloroflexi-10]|nr:MAG: hypothetical protein CVU39_09045 [Chloroflexi bacterium HGW-Chloroflexi-10]
MSNSYNDLVKTGTIGCMKADILLEAERDLFYIAHIRKDIVENRGIKDAEEAIRGTFQIVNELISQNYCSLATWGKVKGPFEMIRLSQEELLLRIAQYNNSDVNPFDIFLIATEKGKEWVSRYENLIKEL